VVCAPSQHHHNTIRRGQLCAIAVDHENQRAVRIAAPVTLSTGVENRHCRVAVWHTQISQGVVVVGAVVVVNGAKVDVSTLMFAP